MTLVRYFNGTAYYITQGVVTICTFNGLCSQGNQTCGYSVYA